MKTLPTQELSQGDYSELRKRVDAILWELVYEPVVKLLRPFVPRATRPALAMRNDTPSELRNSGGDVLIYVVRHGETNLNQEGKIDGWLPEPLSKLGQVQAQRTADLFRGLRVTRIVSSDLSRAAETAGYISRATGVRAELDPLLRPANVGIYEGQDEAYMDAVWSRWELDPGADIPRGGSFSQFQHACDAAIHCIIRDAKPGDRVVVVAHSHNCNLIRAQAKVGGPLRPADFSLMHLYQQGVANVSVYSVENGRLEVEQWDVPHEGIHELANASDTALRRALRDGAVQIVEDPKNARVLFFVAKAERKISDGLRDIGAKLDRRTGTWSLAQEAVPSWVRLEAASYEARAKEAHERVKRLLSDIDGRLDAAIQEAKLAKAADHAVSEVSKGWKASAKTLEVAPDLGEAGRAALAKGLEANAKISIRGWAKEAVQRLRVQVDENAKRGYRAEALAKRIRNEYAVSKGRADLIASQETSNFMSAYREARAKDAGLRRYVWRTSRDEKVRADHKKLDGKVFYYDKPPIVDSATGRRANPGRDFRCRCSDAPVIE